MRLHVSHDARRLARELARTLEGAPLPWNVRELVAVQGRGMERWLSMQLADALGGVGAIDFLYPEHLVHALLRQVLGASAWSGTRWRGLPLRRAVLEQLPSLLAAPEAATLRSFLDGERPDGPVTARRLDLARELAELVDRYTTYRPDLVRSWVAGEGSTDEPWQPLLLRGLGRALQRDPAAAVAAALERLAEPDDALRAALPARLSIFGVTTLPPSYLQLLVAVSRHTDAHLYFVRPSSGYFAEAPDARTLASDPSAGEGEHPLLGTLGGAARDFQRLLSDVDEHLVDGLIDFEPDARRDTVLAHVQRDLIDGVLSRGGPRPLHVLDPSDRSLRVHGCHGRTRQVEVLRDELLRAFVELPDLEPRDVLVLCPNLADYAPLLRAVFGEGDDDQTPDAARVGHPRLRLEVVDRPAHARSPALEAVLAVVELASGRFSAPEVVDVLTRDAIARRFGLDSVPDRTLRTMIVESGIRWGRDAGHRASFGQPANSVMTFESGLDQLMLGQLMDGTGARAFADVPAAARRFEPEHVTSLLDAVHALEGALDLLSTPCLASELPARFDAIADAIALVEEVDEVRDDVRRQLQGFAVDDEVDADPAGAPTTSAAGESTRGDADGSATRDRLVLAPDALAAALREALSEDVGRSRFLGGGITAAGLVPMRAIPFRVICLLGLDEAEFPRRSRSRAFDVCERRRRPGDRRVEDDDRAAFLEAVQSASDRLILLYQARDAERNQELPLSVPVGELLDTVVASCRLAEQEESSAPGDRRDALLAALTVEHRLHAFSVGECVDPKTRAFDPNRVRLARIDAAPRTAPPAWSGAGGLPLRAPDEGTPLTIALDDLKRALVDPTSFFLERRARIEIDVRVETLPDREPYTLDHLETWQLRDEVVRELRRGTDESALRRRLALEGRLPIGTEGDLAFDDAVHRARQSFAEVADVLGSGELPDVRIDATFDRTFADGVKRPVRVIGRLSERHAAGRVTFTSKADGKARFRARLEQAFATTAGAASEPVHLVAFGDKAVHAEVVPAPAHAEAAARVDAALTAYFEAAERAVPFHLSLGEIYLDKRNGALDAGETRERAHEAGLEAARGLLRNDFGGMARHRPALERAHGSDLESTFFEERGEGLDFVGFVELVLDDRAHGDASPDDGGEP